MVKTVVCEKCGNTIEYEDKSVFEGNREFEEVVCPVCGNELCQVFTAVSYTHLTLPTSS